MRKKPAMVADRKMRITRSGHMSRFSSPSPPTKESNNQSIWRGWRETGVRKGGAFGFIALLRAGGSVWRRGEKEEQWRIGGGVVWVGGGDFF
jgi:hypothetical protein